MPTHDCVDPYSPCSTTLAPGAADPPVSHALKEAAGDQPVTVTFTHLHDPDAGGRRSRGAVGTVANMSTQLDASKGNAAAKA
jgi:hypothetical protein